MTIDPDSLLTATWSDGSAASLPCTMLNGGPKLRLETGDWTAGAHLVIDADYQSDRCAKLALEFLVAGEDQPRFHGMMALLPGVAAPLVFPLAFLDGQRVFLPRAPGHLKGTFFGRRIDPRELRAVRLSLTDTGGTQRLRLSAPRLADAPPPPPPPRVLIDALGQWTARDWPGRTPSAEAMVAALRAELDEADPADRAGGTPSSGRYGGSAAHRFAASGFFRTQHDGRRWWLVDPDGHGFFSAGMDCCRATVDATIVPGQESAFAWLPRDDAAFADCWRAPRGGQAASADFAIANLRRAFGDDWRTAWTRLTTRRLRGWGFNTVGNWSDVAYCRASGLPYVIPMPAYPTTPAKLFRDLPDVFAPDFAEQAAIYARFLADFARDPLLIGYFLANEPHWGFGSFNLAAEMLEANPGTHTRHALAAFIAQRYGDDPAAWAAAWGDPSWTSFSLLIDGVFRRPDERSAQAKTDLWDFSREIVRRFIAIPSQACRAVAPNHLNLGMRYAWIASDLFYEASDCVDVFSINCYRILPDLAVIEEISRRTGKPVLIGEFHFGALDRGLPNNGLRSVSSQAERGVAYRAFVECCAADPRVVGVHYFQLNDQALLGRFDGENCQIGFVDVCQRPYPEIASAATATHARLHGVMDGTLPPFAQAADEVPWVCC